MTTASYWVVLGVVGAGTILMRSLPIITHGRVGMPAALERLLRHVPAAALAALVVPSVLFSNSAGEYAFDPARLGAGVVALMVAVRTRNAIATILLGLGSLWAFTALFG